MNEFFLENLDAPNQYAILTEFYSFLASLPLFITLTTPLHRHNIRGCLYTICHLCFFLNSERYTFLSPLVNSFISKQASKLSWLASARKLNSILMREIYPKNIRANHSNYLLVQGKSVCFYQTTIFAKLQKKWSLNMLSDRNIAW